MSDTKTLLVFYALFICVAVFVAMTISDKVNMKDCRASAYPQNAVYVTETNTCYIVRDDYSLAVFKKDGK